MPEEKAPSSGPSCQHRRCIFAPASRRIFAPALTSGNPFLHGLGDELRAIVGTNVLRDATQNKEIREHIDDMDFSFRSIRMARHSCVNSSMMFSILYFLPSYVRSSTKS